MTWRGFITESKAWMGYPEHRVRFWLQFPFAYARYATAGLRFWMRLQWHRLFLCAMTTIVVLITACASAPPPKGEDFWKGARLDQAFHATATFLDRLFPPRAQPEHGGECIGIVWTGTGYRCSESSAKDAGDGQPRQPKKEKTNE